MVRRIPHFAAALLAALAASPALGAKEQPAPGIPSSVAQYVEMLPSAAGPTAPEGDTTSTAPLPTAVAERLHQEGGADTKALEKLATRSDYGARSAPATRGAPAPRASGAAAPSSEPAPSIPTPVAASKTSSDERLLWLGVVMIALLALAGGAFRLRRSGRWVA